VASCVASRGSLWQGQAGTASISKAPELNPIKNVWEYLSANKLAINVFDDYDDIFAKTCEAWDFFANDPNHLWSQCPV
jgi:hypothetical protein